MNTTKDILNSILETAATLGVSVGLKILGAIVLWIIGRWLISLAQRMTRHAMRNLDETVRNYASSALSVLLTIALIVAILGFFGVETTTFAALLAAAGVAIGMAWSGLLAHLAAGVFLLVLRPIKVGDYVTAGTVEGTVTEIGLFVTAINRVDGVRHIVGNNKVFSEIIVNYSANPFRRVDTLVTVDHSADVTTVIDALRAGVAKIPNVAKTPSPDIVILEFTIAGPKIAVRPYTHTDHYWQVYFDTYAVIRETLVGLQAAAPTEHVQIHKAA